MRRVPASSTWEKPQGKRPPLRMAKPFRIIPRGVALADRVRHLPDLERLSRACSRASRPETRCSSSRLDAPCCPSRSRSPSPARCSRRPGFSPRPRRAHGRRAGRAGRGRRSRCAPRSASIDFTGSSEFGTWLEAHATPGRRVHREVGREQRRHRLHRRLRGDARATSRSRCRCTAARCARRRRTCCVPDDGIETDQGHRSFDEVAADLAGAVDGLLGDTKRAAAILGGIVGPDVLGRGRGGQPQRRRRARLEGHRASRVPRRRHPHAAAGRAQRVERERLRPRVLRAGHVRDSDRGHGREPRAICATRHARAAAR